ncbi:hypothetical protein F0562_010346 [Nyssa sinensis]|uniref:Uncharacterized protein n=1 Tax=Nyssa sinensis TaxID=561372 RepID=A0A5J4ZYL9_9ASTE|nr:hypothetical protein F0562_010346 [Nyssa sinensis]
MVHHHTMFMQPHHHSSVTLELYLIGSHLSKVRQGRDEVLIPVPMLLLFLLHEAQEGKTKGEGNQGRGEGKQGRGEGNQGRTKGSQVRMTCSSINAVVADNKWIDGEGKLIRFLM